jgi:hypothetical protein
VNRSFEEFEKFLSDAEIFLITVASRVLAATVDDNAALDGRVVGAKDVHFARAASEAIVRIVDRFLLRVGCCERWLNAWSLKRNPCAFEFLTGSNLDNRHRYSMANDTPSGSKSGFGTAEGILTAVS